MRAISVPAGTAVRSQTELFVDCPVASDSLDLGLDTLLAEVVRCRIVHGDLKSAHRSKLVRKSEGKRSSHVYGHESVAEVQIEVDSGEGDLPRPPPGHYGIDFS